MVANIQFKTVVCVSFLLIMFGGSSFEYIFVVVMNGREILCCWILFFAQLFILFLQSFLI